MKFFGIKLGLGIIVIFSTVSGLVALVEKLGGGLVLLSALAVIGVCCIIDWFAEWMITN